MFRRISNMLQEFSIPLILGVVVSLIVANVDAHLYHKLVHLELLGKGVTFLGHKITPHFLVNDIFMVFFFGIAAKEITESVLPGGPLNPLRKAVNPLLGTIGGVVGPVGVYFLMAYVMYGGTKQLAIVNNGWGIPTATDIALAWLVARIVFGNGHPAVNFLLLLAVADDALGLGIIAIFYPDPNHPVNPIWLLLNVGAMGLAFGMRKMKVNTWYPYIFIAGVMSWFGLLEAHLHPALAFVFIVPFIPGEERDLGLFVEAEEKLTDREEILEELEDGEAAVVHKEHGHSPLELFEHQLKMFVDYGLFFFAFANAGVLFSKINGVTWIVLSSLIVGKMIGITFFSWFGEKIGFPLPSGMRMKHLVVAGIIAGLGLTVALFVSGQAFPSSKPQFAAMQGPAKMGAVLSALAALLAFILGKILGVKDRE